MIDLKKEDPTPVTKRAATNWAEVFERIRTAHLDEGGKPLLYEDEDGVISEEEPAWYNLGEYPAAYVTSIKRGRFSGSEPNEFDATMRETNQKTQRGILFVKYVGGN